MNIVYIKRSYEKLNNNICCNHIRNTLGENIQISELVLNARYIDNIFDIKRKYLELNRQILRNKNGKQNIKCIYLKIKRIIYRYILSLKLSLFEFLVNKTCRKNQILEYKYILSVDISKDENVKNIIKKVLENKQNKLKEYIYFGQYEENLLKYIDKYMKDKNIDKNKIKIGMMYFDKSKIHKKILKMLLEEYKVVDILETSKNISRSKENQYIVNDINEKMGASSNIVNITSKQVKNYNCIVLLDSRGLGQYSKLFDKNTYIISTLNTNADILNTNVGIVNKMIKDNIVNYEVINKLRQNYGLVILSKSLVEVSKKI